FDLNDSAAYARWREQKLARAITQTNELIVEIDNPRALTAVEHDALLDRCRRSNMAIYVTRQESGDDQMVRELAQQFGLTRLDANWLADDEGVTHITVSDGDELRQTYIPYTNRPIKWHTDGYYNPPKRQILAMVLHCVRSAGQGGENRLMDHEIAYIQLRDANPDFIRALSAPDAMTIPERTDENGIARAAQAGPVFSIDAGGNLAMRYTARTRSIVWKQDATTLAAVAMLEQLLAADSSHIHRARMESGMGLLCNNVLHDRSAFVDDPANPRLLLRARYLDRIAGT
ncbi:MAG TPA: TauD/TfdA family dioxygenase, partial [Gallionella sp.]|nr:TauD/TfdA family dioxygenase [Gallionella sp.]